MGSRRAFRLACEFLSRHNPHILFLMETKFNECFMENLRIRLNYHGCFTVNCVGSKGGLCLLWKDEVFVSLPSFSNNHIDAGICWKNNV